MTPETVVAWLNRLVITRTGKCLSDLERTILQHVWQGTRYVEIATHYGCTEGHVKDVSSALWQFLSQEFGEKITKTNFRTAIARYYQHMAASFSSTPSMGVAFGSSVTPTVQPVLTECRAPTHPPSPIPCNPLPINFLPSKSICVHLRSSAFLGRTSSIAHLTHLINQGTKVIVIQGEGGLGKTTLAQQYLQAQGFDLVLELLMAKEPQNLVSAERVVEEWLQQDFGLEPGTEFGVSLARLKRQLHTRRIGILLDNLEPALDSQGHFVSHHRSYVELLRVLSDARVQSVTLVTSRDRLCEASLNVTHYRLPGLDQAAWHQFFQSSGVQVSPHQMPILQQLHYACGGNAKAMGLLCGLIQADFENNLDAYWREHRDDLLIAADLKDLVSSQADRLQLLDPRAYRLFCRLGCYRYQAIPTLPMSALTHLLWDVPATEHRQVIASLRNRSLIEYRNGEYWLHPAVRSEAVLRLRGLTDASGQLASDEWEIVHRRAAEFWTQSILSIETTQDALQALEAYYHYVEIQDFEAAGRVLLKSRNNQWKQYLPLGSTLYRMGLIQPVIAAITQVIENVQVDHQLSELYNILGDVWWIAGEIHRAIDCQEKTIALVTPALQLLPDIPENKHTRYYLKMLAIDSLLSIGLYRVDRWELTEAAELFQQVIQHSQNTAHQQWADKAAICLAWVNSYLGIPQSLGPLTASVITAQSEDQVGRFAYFMQILGQTYVNAGQFEQAMPLFQKALAFAEAGHYKQIQARSLTGMAAVYRHQGKFDRAIACHTTAIDLLERIGARCDLAEALFQQGITHQRMGDMKNCRVNCEQAMELFQAMSAPQQVEKVAAFGRSLCSRS
jgi:tetratricopeptide (TPR) repeat protein